MLFSVCLHYLRCFRSSNGVVRSNYCFYCSHIRARNFDFPSYFFDIVVDQQSFSSDFCRLTACAIVDLDTHQDRPFLMDSPTYINEKCDYYQIFQTPQELMIGFTSILIQMYINFVSEALSELHVTLKDEDLMVSVIYEMRLKLMYNFCKQNVSFFIYLLICLLVVVRRIALLLKIHFFRRK